MTFWENRRLPYWPPTRPVRRRRGIHLENTAPPFRQIVR